MAPAESTAASAAPGWPVVLGMVLLYQQLFGGVQLLPLASSPVNGPAAAVLPLLMLLRCPCSSSPGRPVVTNQCLGLVGECGD